MGHLSCCLDTGGWWQPATVRVPGFLGEPRLQGSGAFPGPINRGRIYYFLYLVLNWSAVFPEPQSD
jgi:hypothetical protein